VQFRLQTSSSAQVRQAFDRAVNRMPWEPSLLSPRSDADPLRIALLAKVSETEREEWQAYARKWWMQRDELSFRT